MIGLDSSFNRLNMEKSVVVGKNRTSFQLPIEEIIDVRCVFVDDGCSTRIKIDRLQCLKIQNDFIEYQQSQQKNENDL